MANPRRSGAGAGPISDVLDDPEPPPPMDPDELSQIQMLAEAVLVSFSANPNPMRPYGRTELQWDITMPTTVLPGVSVEVRLYERNEGQPIIPRGTRTVAPYSDTEFAIYLEAPKAARHLGTLSVSIDLGSCELVPIDPGVVIAIAKGYAEAQFPADGNLTLRSGGALIDLGINSFVIDIPLRASVSNWFDADANVTMSFSLWTENGQLQVRNNLAKTDVSPGALSTVLSATCASRVATAVEATSDGYLQKVVGKAVALEIQQKVQENINQNLERLNASNPARPFRLYDISLTQDGMSYRFCPARPSP